MKRCPKCQRSYDNTLSFCLDDGMPLKSVDDAEETLVLPKSGYDVAVATPTKPTLPQSKNPFLYITIFLLAVFAVGVTVAFYYERDKSYSSALNNKPALPSSAANDRKITPTIEPTPSIAKSPESSPTTLPTPTPSEEPLPPGVTRLALEAAPPGGTTYEATFFNHTVGIIRDKQDLLIVFLEHAEYNFQFRKLDGSGCAPCPQDFLLGDFRGKLPAAYRIKDVPHGSFKLTISKGGQNQTWTVAPLTSRVMPLTNAEMECRGQQIVGRERRERVFA